MIYHVITINLFDHPIRVNRSTLETEHKQDCIPNVTSIWGTSSILALPGETAAKTRELIDAILAGLEREQARQEVVKRELVELREATS